MLWSKISQRGFLALALIIANGSATASEPKAILFLGDSLTAGYGVEPSQAFPALIQQKIDSRGWNFQIINAGQSGDTSAGGLSRLEWVLRAPVDVLVLALGGNDGLRGMPAEVTRRNLQAIIDRTREKYPQVKVVVAGMQLPPNLGRPYVREFRSIFPDLAKRNQTELVPFLLEGVGGVSKLNFADGIHPTRRGHEIVANNVWKILEPLLRSLRQRSGA